MQPTKGTQWRKLLALVPVVIVTVLIIVFRDKVKNLEGWGLPGIFLLSIIANATVIIPVPGVLLTTTMATVFPPVGVALAAGTGAALGEITGYLAGYSGQIVIENRKYYQRIVEWMKKYGNWTIVFLAFIPNPAFDMAGIVAGALKMPITKFLLWCWIGKFLKMLVFALAGSGIMYWLNNLFK
jgi:membrane protein YqaA with SNARE-associated domain